MALDGDPSASLTPNPTFTPNPSKSNKTSTGVIVGATLGGLAAGCLILGTILFFWWRRKKMARSRQMSSDDSESSYSPFRRSALMRDVEQSYPDGQMVQRASVITVPTPNSSSGFPTTASSETATAYPSFGVIPPAKMRDHLSSVTTPQGGDLPAYST
ncbi:hypothetical protein BJ165DRAFT_878519 [Panaeolus papilionaceus]|nr:hypothetical protein BJ165DRAFT_878519 [Panaeolus papilionaceus]